MDDLVGRKPVGELRVVWCRRRQQLLLFFGCCGLDGVVAGSPIKEQ